MFDNGKGGFIEIIDQVNSRINIYQIIIGYFFPMKLFKNFVQVAVKYSLLVWILTIT